MNDLTKYFATHTISEAQTICMKALNEAPVDFYRIITAAHALTLEDASRKRKHYKQRNFMAESFYGNMVGLLYDNYPMRMHQDVYGCPYVLLSKNVRVYPKKLDEHYLPSNIVTKSVKARRAQSLLLRPEQIHTLFIGYSLVNDNDWMQLRGIYASYINKYYPRNTEWALDLNDFKKDSALVVDRPTVEVEDEMLVKVPTPTVLPKEGTN